jgi:hypothetical protein
VRQAEWFPLHRYPRETGKEKDVSKPKCSDDADDAALLAFAAAYQQATGFHVFRPLALKPNATLDANLLRASEQFYKWTTLACK